jgi:hypothetical protein
MTEDERIFSDDMVKFLQHMIHQCGATSSDAYAEANKNPETAIGIMNTQKGTMYSHIQMLFSMVYLTMSSINSVSEKLSTKKDVESIKKELTHKVDEYLGPLKKEMSEWKRSEESAKNKKIYG